MVTRRTFIGGLSGAALIAATRAYSAASDLTELTLADAYEQATELHERQPPLG